MINSLWHTGDEVARPRSSPSPYGHRVHHDYHAYAAIIAGSACERERLALADLLAATAGVRWTGLPDLGWLHGSGELGDRYSGRVEVRLHAAFRHHAVKPDGDFATKPIAQAWRGNGT